MSNGWLVPAGWVVLLDRLTDSNIHDGKPAGKIELVFSTVSQSRVLAAYRIDPPKAELPDGEGDVRQCRACSNPLRGDPAGSGGRWGSNDVALYHDPGHLDLPEDKYNWTREAVKNLKSVIWQLRSKTTDELYGEIIDHDIEAALVSVPVEHWTTRQVMALDWSDGPREGICALAVPQCVFYFQMISERPVGDDLDDRLFRIWELPPGIVDPDTLGKEKLHA